MVTATRLIGAALCSLALGAFTSPASADTLRVPGTHRNLPDALDDASPGDRIIVRSHSIFDSNGFNSQVEPITIDTPGLTIIGRARSGDRVTLPGNLLIVAASDVTLRGLRIHALEVRGNGARFRRVKFKGSVHATADDVSFRKCEFSYLDVTIDGDDAEFTRNRMQGEWYGLIIHGDRASVCRNRIPGGSSGQAAIDVFGDGAVICANNARVSVKWRQAGPSVRYIPVRVTGDGALIARNRSSNAIGGVDVTGAGFEITKNRVDVGSLVWPDSEGEDPTTPEQLCPGITVHEGSSGGIVEANRVIHTVGTGIVVDAVDTDIVSNLVRGLSSHTSVAVRGARNVVSLNSIRQSGLRRPLTAAEIEFGGDVVTNRGASHGIDVDGDGHIVAHNNVDGVQGDGLVITGSGHSITDNFVENGANRGVVVVGDGNMLEGNSAMRHDEPGFVVCGLGNALTSNRVQSAAWGYSIVEGSTDTLLRNNDASDCAQGSLEDLGVGTVIIDPLWRR